MKKLLMSTVGVVVVVLAISIVPAYASLFPDSPSKYTRNITYAYLDATTGKLIVNEGGVQAEIDVSAAWDVYGVAVGDADNDGIDDLVLTVTRTPGSVEIILSHLSGVTDDGTSTLTDIFMLRSLSGVLLSDLGIGNVDNSLDGSQEVVFAIVPPSGGVELACQRWRRQIDDSITDDGIIAIANLTAIDNLIDVSGVGVGNADNSLDGSEEIVVAGIYVNGESMLRAFKVVGSQILFAGHVRGLGASDLRGVGVGNADGSLDGSQEMVFAIQFDWGAEIAFNYWNPTVDARGTLRVEGVELFGVGVVNVSPDEEIYDAGYAAGEAAHTGDYQSGYTKGYTDGQAAGYATGYTAGQTAGYATGYTAGQTAGYATGYTAGQTVGYDAGYTAGYAAGKTAGYALGYTEGYTAGHAVGFNDGWNALLAELPPGIRKNVENLRGFAK